jgi:3-hydroxypropanoate dehydrogenase
VFLRSAEAKERLRPALSDGNVAKTMVAPAVVIVAVDSRFFDHLPEQFPSYAAKPLFEGNPQLAQATAQRNGTLQGAYFIVAARMLGLDCGPMSGFDADKVNTEFFPDRRFEANFLINIGYGDPLGNHPRGPRLGFDKAAQIL